MVNQIVRHHVGVRTLQQDEVSQTAVTAEANGQSTSQTAVMSEVTAAKYFESASHQTVVTTEAAVVINVQLEGSHV